MKQRIRYLLSILLVFAIVLSILPTSAFAINNLAEATYTSDEGQLVESSLEEAFQNVCDEGTVTLLRDVELTETISLENKAVTLLGNGHTVTLAQYKNISLSGTAVLRLGVETDPEASLFTLRTKEDLTTNAELIHLRDQAELYMYNGVTLGPSTSGSTAAGVGVYGNSRFYMYGGTITSCKTPAAVSGGVYVDEMGQFHMYDGVIEDCEGTRGGAVGLATGSAIGGNPSVAAPLFHMYGGTIRNCIDTYAGGGAVSLRTEKSAQFIMDGGTITGCKSTGSITGGGGGAIFINSKTAAVQFIMNGGIISDCSSENSKSGYGGAVYINLTHSDAKAVINGTITDNRAKMGGGLFVYTGNVSVGGTIIGNYASSAGGGIFGNSGSIFISTEAELYGNLADGYGGADLYCQSDCSITLNADVSGHVLPGCSHVTDGWYEDSSSNRWSCDGAATAVKFDLPADGVVSSVALKAAHGANPQYTYITITPANITVYTGGEGYTGVVDNAGHETAASNGLPEPGFYITLPNWLNEQLGGKDHAVNLSDMLTITYKDDEGTTRTWNLELYGKDEQHSTDIGGVTTARYIYRILPGVDGSGNKIPIRMQLKDGNTVITSDEFTPSLTELYKEFVMSIYSGGLDTSKITAQLNVNGRTVTCGVESDTGKLVVRGLTGEDTTTDIVNSESQLSSSNISAIAPSGVTYYINGSNVELSDTSGVKLLVDKVVDNGVLAKYIQENMTDDIPAGNYTYAQQYLDLVDTKNGNAYLTMGDGQKLTVYWPVPNDFDSSKNFYLVHFDGLDRNYKDITTQLNNNPPDVHNATLVTVNGTQYIKFETGAFSPFVLVYEQKASGGTGTRDDYTLHYVTNGGNHLSSETKSSAWTKDYEDLPIPVRDGYTFEGWYWDLRLTEPVTGDVKVDKTTVSLYAKWSGGKDYGPDDTGVSNWLETDEHNAFLSGYPDGSFLADKNMTRAEVAQMFYSLLLDKDVKITKSFSDVPSDAWYAKAVNTLSSLGMLGGYPDGTFRPDAPITRAEFAAIALAFAYDPASASCSYTDVSTSAWYYTYVAQATTYGWIGGYPDGSFRPNNSITRAEVAVIVNNMLGRDADESYIGRNEDELVSFMDLSKNHWAYYTIMEATNTHDYTTSSNGESWKA